MNPNILRKLGQVAPTPIARLAERAQNDCAPERQHHNAYYVFELWLRLTAAIAVARYRATGERDPAIEPRLHDLAHPSVGSFVAFLHACFKKTPDSALAQFWDSELAQAVVPGYRWSCEHGSSTPRSRPTVGAFAEALSTTWPRQHGVATAPRQSTPRRRSHSPTTRRR